MINFELFQRLRASFPGSIINQQFEFIAHIETNQYFRLEDCYTEFDVKCKVLEWLSRGAYKTAPYSTEKKNAEFHQFMLSGINKYLGTNFSHEDMEIIYTYLGNRCNHQRTERFINSGYDLSTLRPAEKAGDEKPICKDCPYKQEYRRNGNSTKEVMCQHPDKEYIRQYFKEHNIQKYEGFLGYINSKGIFPVKKSPKWCPLKQKGGAE